jgi:hypothetical protein
MCSIDRSIGLSAFYRLCRLAGRLYELLSFYGRITVESFGMTI